MKSKITKEFRELLNQLPLETRRQAYAAYRLFKANPYHAGLHFKRVITDPPIYSARVGLHHRVVGVRRSSDTIVWFWIGTHAEYDKNLSHW
ncbi:MAG TPA: hypothetical protein VKQ72_21460 [Aggregatilineales bacterium]|nr:hypothetical protein [Aggregatilineales bacterium]